MSERIEYQGDPLPSGLPGFGGGSVLTLSLPGFNRVVAAQKFGPAVDAPEVTPPDPTPPPGNTPDNPTNEVVTPPTPPAQGPSQETKNFCKQCVTDQEKGVFPLLTGRRLTDSCVNCNGKRETVIKYFSEAAATTGGRSGIFWGFNDGLEGRNGSIGNWSLNAAGLDATLNQVFDWGIDKGGVTLTPVRGSRKYYEPKELKVCIGGQVKTWSVLAHEKQ